jgi:dsRNA-specific ribonuclease
MGSRECRLHGETTSYERLEFLGDRVLNLGVAGYLFEKNEKISRW